MINGTKESTLPEDVEKLVQQAVVNIRAGGIDDADFNEVCSIIIRKLYVGGMSFADIEELLSQFCGLSAYMLGCYG